jgi:peptidoglycan/xylan/chitin deacetylase (PgdA/CDA1 family)
VAGGHELGNHMWDTRPSWRLAQSEFRRDFARTQATLKPFADVRFFRPASGWFNRSMLDFVQAQGCQTTLGSIYPFDAVLKSARFSTSHILRNASPGAIVVLHDNKSRGRRTSKVLGTLLPALLDQGYALVTLSELQKRQSISSEVPG